MLTLSPRIICISQNRFASPLSTFVSRTLIKHKANLILECIMNFQYFKERCPKRISVTSYNIVLRFNTMENGYSYVDINSKCCNSGIDIFFRNRYEYLGDTINRNGNIFWEKLLIGIVTYHDMFYVLIWASKSIESLSQSCNTISHICQ